MTAIITPEQITAARQAAEQADRELTQLQRQASPWAETDSSLALRIEVALAHRDTAHRDAERLANRYQRQQEALQARQTAEQAAEDVLDTINSDLAGLRDRARRDITTAQEALLAAVRSAQTYNRRVRDATEQLGGVGLTALPEGIETNSQPLSYRAGVKLTGQYWLAVDPAAVPRVVGRRVTRATISHSLAPLVDHSRWVDLRKPRTYGRSASGELPIAPHRRSPQPAGSDLLTARFHPLATITEDAN